MRSFWPATRFVAVLVAPLAMLAWLAAAPATASASVDQEPTVTPRIYNGNKAAAGAWPFIVNLSGCGGSLIKPNWVLSAAHCQKPISTVKIGGLKADGSDGESRAVAESIVSPFYGSGFTYNYDFWLLRLASDSTKTPVTMSDQDGDPVGGEQLQAAGWGGTEAPGPNPLDLMEVGLRSWSNAECQAQFQAFPAHSMTCALGEGNPAGIGDTCLGDSGGPLSRTVGGSKTLVGVTSFGISEECADPALKPGYYARVSGARDWIAIVTGDPYLELPRTLSFDDAEVGTQSSATLTMTSLGQVPVTLDSLAVTGDFQITGGSCQPGQTYHLASETPGCSVEVRMSSKGAGPVSGELLVGSESADDNDGVKHVRLSGTATGKAPAIGAFSASNITDTKAVISGEIDPGGLETAWTIEYGPEGTFTETIELASVGSVETGAKPVGAMLTGLTPESTYSYRVIATNDAGSAEPAAVGQFTTLKEVVIVDPTCPGCEEPDPKPDLVLTPLRKNVSQAKKQKKVALKVRVKNRGDGPARAVKICFAGPKWVLDRKSCQTVKALAAGAATVKTLKVKPKRTRKPRKAQIRVTAVATGIEPRSARIRLKVPRR